MEYSAPLTEAPHLRTTHDGYNAVAADYAAHFETELDTKPFLRAMLAAFGELVRAAGGLPVADIGCGPGDVMAHLRSLESEVHGIDLSPAMLATVRRRHPGLRFEEGSMTALDQPDGSQGAVLAWYSTTHIAPDEVPAVLTGFHRVLAPGGYLLLAFQVGDGSLHITEAFGRDLSPEFHRMRHERVAEQLRRAGFAVTAGLVREPDEAEKRQQAHVLAQKHAPPNA